MRPDLMLPLDCLPGPVPVGAPVARKGGPRAGRRGVVTEHDLARGVVHVTWEDGGSPAFGRGTLGTMLAFDLSAPPVDAQGRQLRIDGADVVAGMLARALGLDPSGGVMWQRVGRHAWSMRTVKRDEWRSGTPPLDANERRFVVERPLGVPTYARGLERLWVTVPALASIDPTSPDADRLALAAVCRARVWEVERV